MKGNGGLPEARSADRDEEAGDEEDSSCGRGTPHQGGFFQTAITVRFESSGGAMRVPTAAVAAAVASPAATAAAAGAAVVAASTGTADAAPRPPGGRPPAARLRHRHRWPILGILPVRLASQHPTSSCFHVRILRS